MNEIKVDAENIVKKLNLEFFEDKQVLLTGSSGLMGLYFLSVFQELIEIRNMRTKVFVSSKNGKFNIPINSKIEVISGDLTQRNVIEKMPVFDVIIHAAGYGQPNKFLDNPWATIDLNTRCTYDLIQKMIPGGRFLFISTSEVYSGSQKLPFSEDDIGHSNTNHPRAPYIEAKRLGETLIAVANRSRKHSAVSTRLALAYGPGTKKDDGRVMNDLIRQAIVDGSINLLDSGKAQRTYCYVSDAIELCFAALLYGKEDIYNVGGTSKTTIIEMAQIIASKTNSRLNVPVDEKRTIAGAPDVVSLSIQKILNVSLKKDFISLDEGIEKTINWQKSSIY